MMKVKKVLIYYAIFVLGIALFLLVDNFVGLLKLDKKIDKK